MPLSQPVSRTHIHRREIICQGYLRDDGLWDIEGHLTDTKGYAFNNSFRGRIEPGTPIHEMWLRLTVDDQLSIKAVEAVTDYGPHAECPAITVNFQRLVGLRIGPGWRKAVKEKVGGVEGCTHLVEMLPAMATAAVQTIFPYCESRKKENPWSDTMGSGEKKRPPLLDSCHVYDSRGPYVKERWPEWYEGDDKTA